MDIKKKIRLIARQHLTLLGTGWFVQVLLAVSSSVLVTDYLSKAIADVTLKKGWDIVKGDILAFLMVSFAVLLLRTANDFLSFARSRVTECALEDEGFSYLYRIKYTDEIKKDELHAHLSETLAEYNNLYYSYISSGLNIFVTLTASGIYALSIHWVALVTFLLLGLVTLVLFGQDMGGLVEVRERCREHGSAVYSDLWERVENLEMERYLSRKKVFRKFRQDTKAYVGDRVQGNKIELKADLYSELGGVCAILLMAFLGFWVSGFKFDERIVDILALTLIVPSISQGVFSLPGLKANRKKLEGISRVLERYLDFEVWDENEESAGGLAQKLSVDGVAVSYISGGEVLRDVCFTLHGGDFIALTGENGSGKSTLLKTIAGMHPLSEGRIVLSDEGDVRICGENFRKQIYYFEQIPTVIPGTLEENILLGSKMEKERYTEALKKALLTDFAHPDDIDKSNVSEGERQKIAFARIFYHHYRLLLLDECTARLDEDTEQKLLGALAEYIAAEKAMALAACHRETFLPYVMGRMRIENGKIMLASQDKGTDGRWTDGK